MLNRNKVSQPNNLWRKVCNVQHFVEHNSFLPKLQRAECTDFDDRLPLHGDADVRGQSRRNTWHNEEQTRKRNWKECPPFQYRFNLLEASGNNSKHVECIMHRFKKEWDRVKKEVEASK